MGIGASFTVSRSGVHKLGESPLNGKVGIRLKVFLGDTKESASSKRRKGKIYISVENLSHDKAGGGHGTQSLERRKKWVLCINDHVSKNLQRKRAIAWSRKCGKITERMVLIL